jgi:hypothetical protein
MRKSAHAAPPEWRKEFDDRREAFIKSLRDAVAGSEVVSRVYDAEEGYGKFSKWIEGQLVSSDQGALAEAEAFLRHLIDQGHKAAYAVSRNGTKSFVCVSYDGDQMDWSPVWPADFRVDVAETSLPMTKDW